ncbi:hypothetical protein HCH52_10570 [Oscillospiraceae bacterium HV4-5-C5C]|nr:hypothetical protein [Oscillospiraceae bacterium HV4-5-C5C]
MSIDLAKKYSSNVDELFTAESKKALLTNTDYDWTGAHTVVVYKLSTVEMQDYARNVPKDSSDPESISRYGKLFDLDATTQEMMLTRDRSFIFNVDRLDVDETEGSLEAAQALARQLREKVVPEVDTYTFGKIVAGAGIVATAEPLTEANVYSAILAGSEALDDKEVPETERVLMVTPAVYTMLKKATEFDNTDIGADLKLNGVIGILDGMQVIKVPATRLPDKFGFVIAHPSATVAPVKLEDYHVHNDTPLSSGSIVTGRICYDAFVLDNKKNGIYYQPLA